MESCIVSLPEGWLHKPGRALVSALSPAGSLHTWEPLGPATVSALYSLLAGILVRTSPLGTSSHHQLCISNEASCTACCWTGTPHISVPAQVVQAASTLRLVQRLATEARALQVSGAYFNGSANAQYFYPDQNTTATSMLAEVATVSNVHKALYLGISKHAWPEQSCALGTAAAAFCTASVHCISTKQ